MPSTPIECADDALAYEPVAEAIRRNIIAIGENRVKYTLFREQTYKWDDPEEWVRATTIAWLIIVKGYPANRLKLEVSVPRRTPTDFADIVVYEDDSCRVPYLVVENKASGQSRRNRDQGIEQAFGNANSMRVPLTIYDEGETSALFDVANFPSTERSRNRLGTGDKLPSEYGNVPTYTYIAGQLEDIAALDPQLLETRIRRAHSLIWAGGRRDPLTAFDEWSKLLFAKVIDERTTQTGEPRRFQVGTHETMATVATRIHLLFAQACLSDPTIFPSETRINLPDAKVMDVVRVLQGVAFTRTDVDSIGKAFEQFFGSIFRGGLGQYFTMRQLARFTIAMLDVTHRDFVLDPTAGSGGFLLECLLQVWNRIDSTFTGQPTEQIHRMKYDFAMGQVYGIEVHDILGRICKINLLLHHDGHTNIEANRSALDSVFSNARLNPPQDKFTVIVGNPPFGTEVVEGDDEQLGHNRLENFQVAAGMRKIDSEQVIVEQSIKLLEPGGRLGLILPDGLLNNQGRRSNCPRTRYFIATQGRITAIVSLPDHAFRKSGAQNKTSILFFKKFTSAEKYRFDRDLSRLVDAGKDIDASVGSAIRSAGLSYRTFLGEAAQVGYTPVGAPTPANNLYRSKDDGSLEEEQVGTILGEWRRFMEDPDIYDSYVGPNCTAMLFEELWVAHASHRLDPKYHLFKREARRRVPGGWVRYRLGNVLERREERADFRSDSDRLFKVITIAQTGEIRAREAGKGRNPPEWRATYFEDSPGEWYTARSGDVVFSSIDLWKGCIALVPDDFDGALVTGEFPIYSVRDGRLSPAFLQVLLRSRYYQRAFRAITTGHSNRRRTQVPDFEDLEIVFPEDLSEQDRLIGEINAARAQQHDSTTALELSIRQFDGVVGGRGDQELPEIDRDGER